MIPTKVAAGIKWVKQFKEVKAWLDEVYAEKTGSERTMRAYATELWRFCVWEKKTPTELIKVASDHVKAEMQADIVPPKTYAEKIVLQYFHHLISKTPVDGVVKTKEKLDRVTAAYKYGYLRSFYRYNGIIFKGKTPSATSRSRIHLPTSEDLTKVWKAATVEEKLALGCLREDDDRFHTWIEKHHPEIVEQLPIVKLIKLKTELFGENREARRYVS